MLTPRHHWHSATTEDLASKTPEFGAVGCQGFAVMTRRALFTAHIGILQRGVSDV